MKDFLKDVQKALMTGVSYMIPFVVAGGILIALGFAFGGYNIPNDVAQGANFASTTFWLGKVAFALMVPVLGAYVAYSIGDRPAIAPGMVAGWMATDPWSTGTQASGFLGALIGGIIAGYIVNLLKKIPMPVSLKSLLPTLIIPVLGCWASGLIMFYIVGTPVTSLFNLFNTFLTGLSGAGLVVLGIVQGAMLAFDMGGPLNKVAYAFACAELEAGNYLPMGANFVGSCTPPLGIAFAILVAKNKFTTSERDSLAGLFAGAIGMITEFAIPFAAADPIKVIPSLMVGSAVGCVISYMMGVGIMAPHGGLFSVLLPGVTTNVLGYFVALIVGAAVTAALLVALKKPVTEEQEELTSVE